MLLFCSYFIIFCIAFKYSNYYSLQVLFKMDINGNGLLIERDKLHISMGMRHDKFSIDKFRYMCILSGCDYLASLPGIGLGKARKFINRTSETNIYEVSYPTFFYTYSHFENFQSEWVFTILTNFFFTIQPCSSQTKLQLLLTLLSSSEASLASSLTFLQLKAIEAIY